MAAIEAGKRGRRVLVVDHATYAGEKIRISGGGRCNFTNINATTKEPRPIPQRQSAFALSALSRYTPDKFIALVNAHGIAFHEKTLGQLFCDGSGDADQHHAAGRNAQGRRDAGARNRGRARCSARGWRVHSRAAAARRITCASLVVATGGKSIPKMGATGLGYSWRSSSGCGHRDTPGAGAADVRAGVPGSVSAAERGHRCRRNGEPRQDGVSTRRCCSPIAG